MEEPGQRLRRACERLNLRFRDVEQASQLICGAARECRSSAYSSAGCPTLRTVATMPSLYGPLFTHAASTGWTV